MVSANELGNLLKRLAEAHSGLLNVPSLVAQNLTLAIQALVLTQHVGGGDLKNRNVVDFREVFLDLSLCHGRRDVQQCLRRLLRAVNADQLHEHGGKPNFHHDERRREESTFGADTAVTCILSFSGRRD